MRLALRLAARELRGGLRDFRIFLGCLCIGVTVIAAIGTLGAAIRQGMREEARSLLGGDVEITLANARLSPAQLAFLQRYGAVSMTVSLRAMASAGAATTLVEVSGVDGAYPLVGAVRLSSGRTLARPLASGAIVAERALLDRLGIGPGGAITLGDTPFRLVDTIISEPDRLVSAFGLGPHVLARFDDLARAGLLLPGGLSRYNYHVLLKDPAHVAGFKAALAAQFPQAPWIVKTAGESNRSVQELLDHLQLFLTLTGLSSLLIGGIGISNAIESYIGKKYKTIATLKTLGASRNLVFGIYALAIFAMTCLGTLASLALGAALSIALRPYVATFFPVSTRLAVDPVALSLAAAFGLLTVLSFGLPALIRRIEVRPASLFRGMEFSAGKMPVVKRLIHGSIVILLLILVVASASDRIVAAGFVAAAFCSFAVFAAATRLLQMLARRWRPRRPWARLALANLHRPGNGAFAMMLSIGIGLTVLVALVVVQGNFSRNLRDIVESKAPSYFLINIEPAQVNALGAFLRTRQGVGDIAFSPMIRGRIERLKGVPVEKSAIDSGSKWAIDSDRGFSYAALPPSAATITAGRWWGPGYHGAPLVSLDQRLAKGMGLHVGDTLTVNILGQDVTATIASLRAVNYADFQINFALLFSPGALENFPASWIGTFRVAGTAPEGALIHDLARAYPNISVIRTKDSLEQVQGIVRHIALAISAACLTTMLAGVLVLGSAMAATLDKRIYDMVVLKVVGARRSDIVKMFLAEWGLLAVATGALGAVLGTAGARLILTRLDWLQFHILPGAALGTILLAFLIVAATGLAMCAWVFRVKPASRLRNE